MAASRLASLAKPTTAISSSSISDDMPCAFSFGAVRRGAVGAAVGCTHRKKDQLLGQRVEGARGHDRIEAIPHAAQCRGIVRKRPPEVKDQPNTAACTDITVNGADLRARLVIVN